MKTRISSIVSVIIVSASLFVVCSCNKEFARFHFGEEIDFSISSSSVDTKAVYSGDINSGKERIDWQSGDRIRISCNQVSEPASKFADYTVSGEISSVQSTSSAKIQAVGASGLCWGTGNHTFYSVYPSPDVTGGATKSLSSHTVTASIPSVQSIKGPVTKSDDGNWIATPDLKNMLMTAKDIYNIQSDEDNIVLHFTPLTTAVCFTINNGTGSDLPLTSVQLISGNGKTGAEPVINGDFIVDLDQTGIASGTEVKPYVDNDLKIKYNQAYPLCTSTSPTSANPADRTLTITVGTEAEPLSIAVDETFTFTFFLNPCQDYYDLTFKLNKADGSWMSTRLGYTDGTGIFFPRHKKTSVTGLFVPDGAQWYVNFIADIIPWDILSGETGSITFKSLEDEI